MGRERILAGALLALVANSVYLAARADASLFYFANVALHVTLGVAVAAAIGRLVRRHWAGLDMPLARGGRPRSARGRRSASC